MIMMSSHVREEEGRGGGRGVFTTFLMVISQNSAIVAIVERFWWLESVFLYSIQWLVVWLGYQYQL
jgi:hypothetical protein